MIIAVVLIIAVGPDKMPSMLKTAVKGFRDFQKTTTDLRNAVNIDQLLDLEPHNKRHVLAPPALALSEYERQRENPRFGPDIEQRVKARQLRREMRQRTASARVGKAAPTPSPPSAHSEPHAEATPPPLTRSEKFWRFMWGPRFWNWWRSRRKKGT